MLIYPPNQNLKSCNAMIIIWRSRKKPYDNHHDYDDDDDNLIMMINQPTQLIPNLNPSPHMARQTFLLNNTKWQYIQ